MKFILKGESARKLEEIKRRGAEDAEKARRRQIEYRPSPAGKGRCARVMLVEAAG